MAITKGKLVIGSIGVIMIIVLLVGFTSWNVLPTAQNINTYSQPNTNFGDMFKGIQTFFGTTSNILNTKPPSLP